MTQWLGSGRLGRWLGFDGDAAMAEVTQQQQQRLQWEMFKKGFKRAHGTTTVVAGDGSGFCGG